MFLIATFDITRLPALPVRSQHFNRLIRQRLLDNNRKTRLPYQDKHSLFSTLIISTPQSTAQE